MWWTGKMRRDCYKPKAANPWSRAWDSFKAMNIITRGVCQGTRCCKWKNNFHGLASVCDTGRGGEAGNCMQGWEMVAPVAKWVPSKIFGLYWHFCMEENEPAGKERREVNVPVLWAVWLCSAGWMAVLCGSWLLGRSGCWGSLSRWW